MSKVEMIVENLRHRGLGRYDLEAEINFRKDNITLHDEKCFGYTTEELESALKRWNEF